MLVLDVVREVEGEAACGGAPDWTKCSTAGDGRKGFSGKAVGLGIHPEKQINAARSSKWTRHGTKCKQL